MATERAAQARQAEEAYREQLTARATFDYDGRMKLPPPRQREEKRFGGGYHSRGTSGLYDWFYELAPAEQQRLRANWMSPKGFPVDELEDHMPITEWLSLTRRIDMSRAIARGKRIARDRYGTVDPDKVLVSGAKLEQLKRRAKAGRRPRGRDDHEDRSSRCHFFTDDDGVVHPIAKTCEHRYSKAMSAAEKRERYGDDEAF